MAGRGKPEPRMIRTGQGVRVIHNRDTQSTQLRVGESGGGRSGEQGQGRRHSSQWMDWRKARPVFSMAPGWWQSPFLWGEKEERGSRITPVQGPQ